MPRKQPRTILQLATRRLGQVKGGLAAAHIAQWVMVTAELGRVPTTVEYSEWWAVDERTGWRHRAECRAVLGDEWQSVVQQLADHVTQKQARSPRAVMGLALSA